MSLVGPRPCIPYETELFEPHHFERFSVPAGLTGLWQVTARAHSPFVGGARARRALRAELVVLGRHRAAAEDARPDRPAEGDPMSEPLRVAVVGLGYWGPNLLRNLVELDEAEVVTMCDEREERLEHWGRRYPAIERTASYMEVLSDDRVEAVVIATPVSTHFELASQRAAVRQAHVRREAARGELRGGSGARAARAPRGTRADAGPHVPLQPARRAGEGADRPRRPRRALLRLVEPRQPGTAPAGRERRLGSRPARLLDPALLARRVARRRSRR